jgi:predicted HTH domain antitoxin
MSETVVEVKIPSSLFQLGIRREDVQHLVVESLVLSLFVQEHISSGKAARLLGMSRAEFLALLRTRGIAYINYSAEELAEEFAAVQRLPVETVK